MDIDRTTVIEANMAALQRTVEEHEGKLKSQRVLLKRVLRIQDHQGEMLARMERTLGQVVTWPRIIAAMTAITALLELWGNTHK